MMKQQSCLWLLKQGGFGLIEQPSSPLLTLRFQLVNKLLQQ